MSRLPVILLVAVTAIGSIAVWESARKAWAQPVCDEEISEFQGEVKKCLDQADELKDAKS